MNSRGKAASVNLNTDRQSDNLVDPSVLVRLINTEESTEGLLMLMLQCYLKIAFEPRELCHHVIFYTL